MVTKFLVSQTEHLLKKVQKKMKSMEIPPFTETLEAQIRAQEKQNATLMEMDNLRKGFVLTKQLVSGSDMEGGGIVQKGTCRKLD